MIGSAPAPASAEIAVSSLLDGQAPNHPDASDCRLLRTNLQDGLDVVVWKGDLSKPVSLNLRDDWNRVNFCCALEGSSQFAFGTPHGEAEHLLEAGVGCISYTPDCRGRSIHSGRLESLSISLRPELVQELAPEMDASLKRRLESGRCYAQHRCAAELRATAQSLSQALKVSDPAAANRSRLWLLGQSLVLVSLLVEACGDGGRPSEVTAADRRKLLKARDLLLADLTQAPTIAMLAGETGLSVLKLKRGFRQLFGRSVYGLFQQERMQEAKRRLIAENAPVMNVAADLGYTNASHFAVAFQKQFGVKPSVVKRRR